MYGPELTPEEKVQLAELVKDVRKKVANDQAKGKTLPKRVKVTIEFTASPNIPVLVDFSVEEHRYGKEVGTLDEWYQSRIRNIHAPSRFVIDQMTSTCRGLIISDETITMSIEDIPVGGKQ